jgi:hypothetical protein
MNRVMTTREIHTEFWLENIKEAIWEDFGVDRTILLIRFFWTGLIGFRTRTSAGLR